ncbi:MAG: hypothetical protein ABI467_30960 [Kofleriaceae bacterium]
MRAVWIGVLVAACGDQARPPGNAPPDATAFPEVVPACTTGAQTQTFDDASAFGPVVAGTLAAWDPAGRWFLTGVALGDVSSVMLQRQADGTFMFDRSAVKVGTLTADSLFERDEQTYNDKPYLEAHRISNLAPDGTLKLDRAQCYGGSCEVCTAKVVRATHNTAGDVGGGVVGGVVEGEGDGLTMLGQLAGPSWGPGYTFNVRVAGTTAYLIRQDGLHIIDTTDPTNPTQLGLYRRAHLGYSNDVKLVDANAKRYAVIADYGVDVVDVSNPANPTLVATIPEDAHTDAIEARDGKVYAYFGTYDGTCPIYDLTDPEHPAKLGQFAVNGMLVHDLSIEHGIAYLNAWDQGFVVVDFTNPAAPVRLGAWSNTPTRTSHSNWTTTIDGRHIALHGEESYGAKLDLVDVDPAAPGFMQSFATWQTRPWVSIHNLMAFGTKAYFTYYQDGVRVLDLSDPTRPTQIGYFNTWDPQADYTSSDFFEGAVGIDVDRARHLVFVADSPRGLLILGDDTP